MISLGVHELCTNAFKYGALSSGDGRVEIRWRQHPADESRFDFEWAEKGGPPASEPDRQGFGMRILRRGMELESGGRAEVAYTPEGLRYRLSGARHSGPPRRADAA